MQETVERTNNRFPPSWIELLIRERNKGKSLRQLGQMFGRSHETVRQVLAKYDRSQRSLLPEARVIAKLGYPREWFVQMRREGLINPTKPSGHWLYSEELVRQIPSLIAEMRKCERCGELRPPGYRKFCRECSQLRKRHYYRSLGPKEKAEHRKKCVAWRKANPEKWKEISSRAHSKSRAKV